MTTNNESMLNSTQSNEEEKLLKRMVTFAEELLKTGGEQVGYQQILENLLVISKAKFGVLTLLDERTGKFTTVAVAGMQDKLRKAVKILGFDLIGKEWDEYSIANEPLKGQIVSQFSSLSELAGSVIPEEITKPLEKLLAIGEVVVTKIIVNGLMVGDISLILPAGKHLQNETLVEIYSRQIIMFFTRVKAEEEFIKTRDFFELMFNISPDANTITRLSDGLIVNANEGFVALAGFARDEFIVKSSLGLNLYENPADRQRIVKEISEKGFCTNEEAVFRRKDGSMFTGLMSSKITTLDGVPHIFSSIRDITERKLVEEALRESEEKYRIVFNNEIYAICIFDLETLKLLDVNAAYTHVYGYSREELISGMTIHDITAENQESEAATARARQEGTLIIPLRYHRKKDGSVFPVEIVGGPYKWKGRMVMFALAHDISERRGAEESLRKSEAALKKAQQVAQVGSWVWNIQQNRLEWSDEMYRIFGIEKENFSGSLADVMAHSIHPDDRAAVEDSNRSVVEEKKPFPIEYRVIRPDGTQRVVWAEAGEFLLDQNGNPDILTGIVQDITERKRTEAALRESEERFSLAINGTGAGLWDWDMVKDQVVYSEQWKKMLGYEVDEIEDSFSAWKNLWHPEDCADIEKAIEDYLAGKTDHYEIIYRCRHKNGAWRWILTRGDIVKDAQNKPVRWVGTNIDITGRRQEQEIAAQQSQQLRLVYEASQKLNSTLDLDEIYQVICDFTSVIAPNDGFIISDYDDETKLITCRAYWMENQWLDVRSFPPIPLEAEGKGTQSIAIRTGQSMLIRDFQAQQRTAQSIYYVDNETGAIGKGLTPDEGDLTRSALIVPLKTGGKVTGALQVMSYRLNAYTEDQLKLLDALALHIASAGQNALLYTRVQTELDERRRVEVRIKHSEELLNEAQRISKIASWEFNLITHEFFLSTEGYSIYEVDQDTPPEELFGAFRNRLHPEDLIKLDVSAKIAVEKGVSYSFELRAVFDDDRIKNITGVGEPIKDTDGKLIGMRGIFQDISERKRVENKLKEQLDELSRWRKAMVGRELRTIELKKEVNVLLAQAGQPPRYANIKDSLPIRQNVTNPDLINPVRSTDESDSRDGIPK